MTDIVFNSNVPPSSTALNVTIRQRYYHRYLLLIALLAIMLLTFVLNLSFGSVDIPLNNVVKILAGMEADKAVWETIILKFRLPKALTAMLAGAALGVSGLQMQTLFRNPLAGPFVLGISSGASLGVALVVLGSTSTLMGTKLLSSGLALAGSFRLVMAATLGAAAVMMLVLLIAGRVRSTMTLLIVGLMFGYGTGAVVSLLMYFSAAERIQAYINWTFGSFGGVAWGQMQVFAPAIIIGLALAYPAAKPLNALLLGDDYARSMGVAVNKTRFWIILSTAILAGAVTAFCGPIAFLGLAVPHIARSLFNTADHRTLLPSVALLGAILALMASLVAGLPGSQTTLPLNAVTALIGAPVVIWVILRRSSLNM